jgi:hypothetical protein
MSIKNSNYTIGNRTRDLPACSAVPQPIAPSQGCFTPGKETRYPLCSRLCGPHGRSGRVQNISSPTGIRSPDRRTRSDSLYLLSYRGRRRAVGYKLKTTQEHKNNTYNTYTYNSILVCLHTGLRALRPKANINTQIQQKCIKINKTESRINSKVKKIMWRMSSFMELHRLALQSCRPRWTSG